jgi:hypothetical protein
MNKLCMNILLTLSAFIMISSAYTVLLGQTPQTANAQISIFTRVLNDDPAGHAAGWDPDGSRRSFNIIEPEFAASDNMVLINTVQANFVVCSVDSRGDGFFEVNCIETTNGYFPSGNMTVLEGGPDDGATLYYTVIHSPFIPSRGPPPPGVLAEEQNLLMQRGLG